MGNKSMEFPHPVLTEYSKDFIGCNFSINVVSHSDNGTDLIIGVDTQLKCTGLEKLINEGIAEAILRCVCYRTSYRMVFPIAINGVTSINISKKVVSGEIELQGLIVINRDYDKYKLQEFNQNYFGTTTFSLRKGDVLAIEPGFKIKLDTVLEKNAAGVVLVSVSDAISDMQVVFSTNKEEDPNISNYITIVLPKAQYESYAKMRTKKYLKNGIERFLHASLVLPAITEAIDKLKFEEFKVENLEDGVDEIQYRGTVWAESIRAALAKIEITSLADCSISSYELANKILGDVVGDSLNNLMQKMIDWSTVRQEDEVL